jgi:hypothetical protein
LTYLHVFEYVASLLLFSAGHVTIDTDLFALMAKRDVQRNVHPFGWESEPGMPVTVEKHTIFCGQRFHEKTVAQLLAMTTMSPHALGWRYSVLFVIFCFFVVAVLIFIGMFFVAHLVDHILYVSQFPFRTEQEGLTKRKAAGYQLDVPHNQRFFLDRHSNCATFPDFAFGIKVDEAFQTGTLNVCVFILFIAHGQLLSHSFVLYILLQAIMNVMRDTRQQFHKVPHGCCSSACLPRLHCSTPADKLHLWYFFSNFSGFKLHLFHLALICLNLHLCYFTRICLNL